MGAKTGIAWTQSTWNMIVGCSKVSPGCANCLGPNTPILTVDLGWRRIAELVTGDEVLGFTEDPTADGERHYLKAVVERAWATRAQAVEIRAGEHVITASLEHRFLLAGEDGWREASALRPGMMLVDVGNDEFATRRLPSELVTRVDSIRRVGLRELVDIQTSTGTFIADGIATHNCYAETLALRFGWSTLPWTPANAPANVILRPDKLDLPLRWQDPRRIFTNSLSDLHHELVPDEFIDAVYAIMALAPRHIYQVLTKRPERMRDYLTAPGRADRVREAMSPFLAVRPKLRAPVGLIWPLPQVWQGVTIENDRWTGRADILRATPAAVRFISAEPLLSGLPSLDLTGIDQVIVGGESGKGARMMKLEWARDIQRLADKTDTAFFMKQTGVELARELGLTGKGDALSEWPADLQIQEEPAAAALWLAR